ncbi:hypothetical protein D9756_008429 [Leucocoprinus leucothites]|uniref:Uncharacterized protein n=1 Tax=Leucocoprinus leucothites TaxID=201217 RepID=A0A8H5FWC9_9AGAR|nr:hypothetical protein D9756_008429 [Leucoagaricus leucothites]
MSSTTSNPGAQPPTNFNQPNAPQVPEGNRPPAGFIDNLGIHTARNSPIIGNNLNVGGSVTITITDSSQLITGDNMQVNVAARSSPIVAQQPQGTASKA